MRLKMRVLVTVMVIVELLVLFRIFREEVPPNLEESAQEVEPKSVDFALLCKITPPEDFSELVREISSEYKIDPRILAVTVYRESKCDQWALGSSGEIGLTQVLPRVWLADLKEAGIVKRSQELWDPRNNLRASAWIFKRLHEEEKGNIFSMFRRYNGRGPKARKYALEQKQVFVSMEAL